MAIIESNKKVLDLASNEVLLDDLKIMLGLIEDI